jgi:hypothetical protein
VKFNGRFRWVIIDLDSLQDGELRFYFTMYATTQVPFNAVVLPGTEGAQRTLFVRHPVTREIVCARYICFLHETYEADTPIAHFLFEVRVTGEQLTVPISEILPNFPTDPEKKAFDDLQVRKQYAQADTIRFPLALPRTDPVQYPFFSHINLLVLFLLLKKLKQAIEPTYESQKILIRFLACEDQSKFYQELPTLSDEDEVLFREFGMTYTQVFMGHPMTSQTQRFSTLSVQQVF